jgi:hypothetical protein
MYIDSYAVIVQKDMDGGDTLHREGLYAFGKKLRFTLITHEDFPETTSIRRPASEDIINQFEVAPGIYIRHPDPAKWYSNPDATSRDQLIPVIAYCAAAEDYPRLWRLFKATVQRGMFAQNFLRIGDSETERKIPDPMHLNMAQFIRAGGWWTAPLYPLLYVYDTLELVGTVLSVLPLHFQDDHWIPRMKMADDVDDNNIVVQHLLAAVYKPTLVSELNRYVYAITRPRNLGNTVLGETNPVMGALSWYHRDDYNGEANPEIAEIYRPLIEKYFTYLTPKEFLEAAWNEFQDKKTIVASD